MIAPTCAKHVQKTRAKDVHTKDAQKMRWRHVKYAQKTRTIIAQDEQQTCARPAKDVHKHLKCKSTYCLRLRIPRTSSRFNLYVMCGKFDVCWWQLFCMFFACLRFPDLSSPTPYAAHHKTNDTKMKYYMHVQKLTSTTYNSIQYKRALTARELKSYWDSKDSDTT